MSDERRHRSRALPPEEEPTAAERAEAEALRLQLEGEGEAAGEVARTADFLSVAAQLPGAAERAETVAEARGELLASLPHSPPAAERSAPWWQRLFDLRWPFLVPVGAAAALGVMVMVTVTVTDGGPMMEQAPVAGATESPQRVGPPAESLAGGEQAPAVVAEAPAFLADLPAPPRSLLLLQAEVAGGDGAGLKRLRAPMAEYPRQLYDNLSARYRRQADADAAAVKRVAAR